MRYAAVIIIILSIVIIRIMLSGSPADISERCIYAGVRERFSVDSQRVAMLDVALRLQRVIKYR